MRQPLRSALLVSTAAVLTLAGCGAEDDSPRPETATSAPSPAETPTEVPSSKPATPENQDPDAVTIDVIVRGDTIKPGPRLVKVKVGKPVVFRIDSDRPGGLHVHSSPEQSPEFKAGKSTITITLDMPGVVEVEEHEADALIAQLEAR